MNRLARSTLFAVGTFLMLLPATTVMTQENAGFGPVLGDLGRDVAPADSPASRERRASAMDAQATTPGTTYASFDGIAFRPDANNDGSTAYVVGGGIRPTAYGWYYVHLDLPQAATITELSWYWKDNSANDMTFYLYRFGYNGFGESGTAEWSTTTSGASTDIQTTSVTGLNTVVDNTSGTYMLYMLTPADPGLVLYGARVGYVTASPAFYPITPTRVYDSLCTGGMIVRGRKRTIRVATGVTSQGCAIGADVVPAGARAITYNLTIKSTVAKGWLGVVPKGATFHGTSSISWFGSGQTLTNGGVVSLGGDRRLDVYAGGVSGARTHFIVDITGYYK